MNTATFIRDLESSGPVVRASLYRVDPPMTLEVGEYENEQYRRVMKSSEYVRVSASNVPYSGPETYIFLADDQGHPINWLECAGSYRGGLDHQEALENAEYKVVRNDDRNTSRVEDTNACLTAALSRAFRLERRLIGWHSAVINATKNVDRIVLANDADSLRLELEIIRELLQEAGRTLNEENGVRCKNCGRDGTYVPGQGCPSCHWLDDEEND